jgi:pyruvate kinase
MRKARIVCTIGPASGSPKIIEDLIKAGMDVARLNMSHGTTEDHRACIRAVRNAADRSGRPVAILLDLQGVKVRISEVAGDIVNLKKGKQVRLRSGHQTSNEETLYISCPTLVRDVGRGHRVLLDDGMLELVVTSKTGDTLTARVVEGGVLTSRKGVNLPDSVISARTFTDKDRRDLEFGVREGVDAFALSYVTRADDVLRLRRKLHKLSSGAPVIAKIEKPAAVQSIEEILNAADGIMVARGDLAVECSYSLIPLIQKSLIRAANRKHRLVITATQMLESMRTNPVPTRAETADVANAILDGSDAVMLSGETSVGKYPVRTVKTMAHIVEETELGDPSFRDPQPTLYTVGGWDEDRGSFAVADAAVRAASDLGARCIVAFTHSGYTARLLAKFRPVSPIVAFTPDPNVVNRMKLYWGVLPDSMRFLDSTDVMIAEVERTLMEKRYAKAGENVVITASLPMESGGRTNFMKVHRIKKAGSRK